MHDYTASVSAEVADRSRERPRQFWDPGRKLLLAIRRYQHWRGRKGALAVCACKLNVMRPRFWSVITGADIPLNCNIGGGLLLVHPNGIVIHPQAKVGVNCLIFQQVTTGAGKDGAPQIAGRVDIGCRSEEFRRRKNRSACRDRRKRSCTKRCSERGSPSGEEQRKTPIGVRSHCREMLLHEFDQRRT
jgi:serine O-acetyltransferase